MSEVYLGEQACTMKIHELLALFLPRACAACGLEGVSLCGTCLRAMAMPVTKTEPRYGIRPIVSACEYTGAIRACLIAYKEHERRDIAPVLALLLARAVAAVCEYSAQISYPVTLVPVPTSPRASRRRGGNHMSPLAYESANILANGGIEAQSLEILSVTHKADQVGRTLHNRNKNVDGKHFVSSSFAHHVKSLGSVIVVDDIATSGATLAESARALEAAGVKSIASPAVIGLTPGGSREDPRNGI